MNHAPEIHAPEIHDRAEGYVTEIGYTFDYHRRTNPLFMRPALLAAGLQPPRIDTACELGFGQGVSLAFHAAAGAARWIGNDINPDHVAHARRLVEAAGVSADLYADSFVDFAARTDLPGFDVIVMHGIWSWVSDRNRAAIVDFVGRRLKPGGVLYVSYNALPGQATVEPLRHLVTQHARRAGGHDGIVGRIDRAVDFADRLLGTMPSYLQESPRLRKALDALKNDDRRYLAHEYFNRDWRPMHFAEVVSWLAPAGLAYAGSAAYASTTNALVIEPAQRALLDGVEDPVLQETVRDFLLDRSFRQDIWVKPPVARAPAGALRDERIVRVTDQPGLPFEVRAPLLLRGAGPADPTATATLDLLSDGRPRSLADIEAHLGGKARPAEIVAVVELLLDHGLVGVAQPDESAAAAHGATARLNAHLLAALDSGSEVRSLASPVLGGGVEMSLVEQHFLRAWRQGKSSPDQWAATTRDALDRQSPRPASADTLEALTARATAFAERKLPLLKALLVA